jgi:hypothetical protein
MRDQLAAIAAELGRPPTARAAAEARFVEVLMTGAATGAALVASGHQAHQCATLCAVPFVSSDADAWMRLYYEAAA